MLRREGKHKKLTRYLCHYSLSDLTPGHRCPDRPCCMDRSGGLSIVELFGKKRTTNFQPKNNHRRHDEDFDGATACG
ncbi:hypothetical protein M514_02838 [Trichuris suis]|uniref:Uncharacterized protein n=1 Tax=Trichuris suis TaxID=68888 RepID=A0A085MGN7_9BILA|nr:hypothetical protein M513_02838 [Trichuris suis]KFD67949.1 hypothetical protein M514_02838 [Trichuris suis]